MPLRSCMPRRCVARSTRCWLKRRPTWMKARGDRVTFMNAARAGPAWMVIPMNVDSRIRRRTVDEIAQAACIIRCRDHRATASPGARSITVRIGYLAAPLELECGVFLKEGHHAWRGIEEGSHLGFVKVIAEHVAQVGPRCIRVFGDPGTVGQRVQGRPHPTARPGGGAAEHWPFLRHNHLQAVPGGDHCSRGANRN